MVSRSILWTEVWEPYVLMPSHANEIVNLNSNNNTQLEHAVENDIFHDNNNDNMVEDDVEMII